MADFNDILSKSKDIAQTAAEKSQEIYQISKLGIELADLKRKKNQNFSSIGKQYYEAVKEGADVPDFTANIEEIDLLNDEIEQKQALIDELKESIKSC